MIDQRLSSGSAANLFSRRVDPRAKLFLLLLFYLLLFLIPSGQLMKLAACTMFFLTVVWLVKIPPANLLRFLLKIYPMIMLVGVLQITNAPGLSEWSGGRTFLGLGVEAWTTILGFQIKSLLAVSAGYLIMASTSPTQIVSALNRLRLPGAFVAVIFFAYQFLFICAREIDRLVKTLRSRYVRLSLRQRLKLSGFISITYFMRLLERSEGLNRQLLSRGFNGSVPLHSHLRWQLSDSFVFAAVGIVILSFIFIV